MILSQFYRGGDPLDLTPALFIAMLARVQFVRRSLAGNFTIEEAMAHNLNNQIGDDW